MNSEVLSENLLRKTQTLLLLRWVLIIATAYLMLFSRTETAVPLNVALFVAAYFASNIVLTKLLPRIHSDRLLHIGIVLFDVVAVSVALAMTDNVADDFFVLYFLVVFLGALTERLTLVVGAAVISSVVHLTTIARFVDLNDIVHQGYILRVPFLFVVALFFGYFVQEEAETRKQMQADFLSTVTHDIKNPLGVIQSMAEVLMDTDTGPLNEQQTDLIHRIHANVRRVLGLALNLLDAARIEAGRFPVRRRAQELTEVLRDALSVASSAACLKGIHLQFNAEPGLPLANIDFAQMERAVSNLLDNAIKYTPEGGTVSASIRSEEGQLVLVIGDNGPGIPPADLPLLFEKYRRKPDAGHDGGTGLGLFIVQGIVEAHGGSVEVESVPGWGTAVAVRMDAATPASTESLSPDHPRTRRTWQRRAKKPEPVAVPASSSHQRT